MSRPELRKRRTVNTGLDDQPQHNIERAHGSAGLLASSDLGGAAAVVGEACACA
jgi:hypothetical protein